MCIPVCVRVCVCALQKKTRALCYLYQSLSADDKSLFLTMLSRDYGVDHDSAGHMAHALYKSRKVSEIVVIFIL